MNNKQDGTNINCLSMIYLTPFTKSDIIGEKEEKDLTQFCYQNLKYI